MNKTMFSGISRRQALKALGAAGVTYSMLPMMSRMSHAANEVHYHTWSGYDAPELFGSYTEKYGGMPEISYIANEEESLAKMVAGWSPDLLHPGNYNVKRWQEAGMLQPLDTSKVKNWSDIFESVQAEESAKVDGKQYMIPSEFGNSSVVYRTDLVDQKYIDNPSWEILYDEKYKGRIAFYDAADSIVEIAARVLGMDNIFDLSDEQLVEVKKLAVKQRDLLRFYWSSPTELEQALASGEVVAAYGWNQTLVNLKAQGLPVDMMVPKEGIFAWIAGFVMHKDCKNQEAAYDLIDAWTAPESGAWLINSYGYGSTNKKAYDLVDSNRLAELGFARPDAVLENSIFFQALSPEIDKKYQDLATEVQAGG
ncbi:MAG: extracellular solute-binding protein [Rhodospirillaceae bacterium]|nr:extracellular solute-binding protein [Rhodospirillaceae bacterium]